MTARSRRSIVVGAVAAVLVLLAGNPANAAIPVGQTFTGKATYYDDAGYGACGTLINAATDNLVAVSYTWWTTANPNNDPVCNLNVEVSYNGTTVTIPVRDKCPSCDSTHLDLSKPVFQRFANTDQGVINGITWKFVNR
jgi:expansin (peptidoglycan-binding protein)